MYEDMFVTIGGKVHTSGICTQRPERASSYILDLEYKIFFYLENKIILKAACTTKNYLASKVNSAQAETVGYFV